MRRTPLSLLEAKPSKGFTAARAKAVKAAERYLALKGANPKREEAAFNAALKATHDALRIGGFPKAMISDAWDQILRKAEKNRSGKAFRGPGADY